MPTAPSLATVADAAALLGPYCNPRTGYGWYAYDDDPGSSALVSPDVRDPARLSYPIHWTYVSEMSEDSIFIAECRRSGVPAIPTERFSSTQACHEGKPWKIDLGLFLANTPPVVRGLAGGDDR